jgi:hypothetical protein
LEHGLHPPDERDLSMELDKACTYMDRTSSDCAIDAERLSWQVVQVSGILVNLGMLPIQDISQLPKTAWEVLPVINLILKRLQEALASGTNPWD